MRRLLPSVGWMMLTTSMLSAAGLGQAADLVINYVPVDSKPASLPDQSPAVSILLDPVIVTAKPQPEVDESFKRAKDRIAAFGKNPVTDKGLLGVLGFELNPPQPQNTDPNDKAALASRKGLATAGCAGCGIPENRLP